MKSRQRLSYAIAASLALTGGCAAPQPAIPAPGPAAGIVNIAQPTVRAKAERVADALLMAVAAERINDAEALATAAIRLERLGASPQTDNDNAALQRWRANMPADAPPMRGRTLGPAYQTGTLGPRAVTHFNQTFLGGRSAQIIVRVANGPAPRLVVYDQTERQICAAQANPITCRWVPLYTQRHRIDVINIGSEQLEFVVVFD